MGAQQIKDAARGSAAGKQKTKFKPGSDTRDPPIISTVGNIFTEHNGMFNV